MSLLKFLLILNYCIRKLIFLCIFYFRGDIIIHYLNIQISWSFSFRTMKNKGKHLSRSPIFQKKNQILNISIITSWIPPIRFNAMNVRGMWLKQRRFWPMTVIIVLVAFQIFRRFHKSITLLIKWIFLFFKMIGVQNSSY